MLAKPTERFHDLTCKLGLIDIIHQLERECYNVHIKIKCFVIIVDCVGIRIDISYLYNVNLCKCYMRNKNYHFKN